MSDQRSAAFGRGRAPLRLCACGRRYRSWDEHRPGRCHACVREELAAPPPELSAREVARRRQRALNDANGVPTLQLEEVIVSEPERGTGPVARPGLSSIPF